MINLMLGDCLERMKEIPDGSVDLTVTSPPYDNLRTYNGTLNDWTPEKWQAILRELFRVTKDGGVVVWVVADATIKGSETGTSFRQALYAMECGFRLHDTMIWDKLPQGAVGSNLTYLASFEYMFVFSRGRIGATNLLCDRPNKEVSNREIPSGRRNGSESVGTRRRVVRKEFGKRANIWVQRNTERSLHPAVFPLALAQDHILSWSNEGDTVFDPFLGSGTTGVACVNTGRRFIGIERDEGYFTIAENRIKEAQEKLGGRLL